MKDDPEIVLQAAKQNGPFVLMHLGRGEGRPQDRSAGRQVAIKGAPKRTFVALLYNASDSHVATATYSDESSKRI